MAGQTYRDLDVWQKSMSLVVEIYAVSKLLPREEQFGLTNQLRRAAVSIPANIAEGQGRLHHADFRRFLSIARGSLTEAETHLLIANRLSYVSREQIIEVWKLAQEVGRLLNGLIRSMDDLDAIHNTNGNTGSKVLEETELYDTDYRVPATDY